MFYNLDYGTIKKMSKKYILVLLAVVTVLVIAAVVTFLIHTKSVERVQNEALKTLFSDDKNAEFIDSNNNPVDLSQYKDTILVVNVWASWSPYTAVEFPILNELAGNFKDKGVKFLVMNRKETKVQIDRYLASIPTYPNLEQIIDVNDFFYAGTAGYAMPETVIYDSKGKIIQHIRGVVVKEELAAILNTALEAEK